jgi:low affinity Fe/Cu permease
MANQQTLAPSNGIISKITFSRFAAWASTVVGSSGVFICACGLIGAWLLSGPLFHYSDTWQLIINTATTIVTFLMVFLIQNTQNRDTRAINLKLDEIIRSIQRASNEMINIEKLKDEELAELSKRYELIRKEWDHRTARALPGEGQKNVPAA